MAARLTGCLNRFPRLAARYPGTEAFAVGDGCGQGCSPCRSSSLFLALDDAKEHEAGGAAGARQALRSAFSTQDRQRCPPLIRNLRCLDRPSRG